MFHTIFLKYPLFVTLLIATSSYAVVKLDQPEQKYEFVEVLDAYQEQTNPFPQMETVQDYEAFIESEQHVEIEHMDYYEVKDIKYHSTDYKKDVTILTEALFHEARGDNYEKVFAVIMNRLHHKNFPNTVEGVVYQPRHFSYVSDLSPKERKRIENFERIKYNEIRLWVHTQLHNKTYVDTTGGALYYYAYNKIGSPSWWDEKYATVSTSGHSFATWHKIK